MEIRYIEKPAEVTGADGKPIESAPAPAIPPRAPNVFSVRVLRVNGLPEVSGLLSKSIPVAYIKFNVDNKKMAGMLNIISSLKMYFRYY